MDFDLELLKLIAVITPFLSGFVWINKKLGEVKKTLYDQSEKILTKLEYHERHDDDRFEGVRKDLWQLRVANAARTGHVNGDK